MRPGPFAGELFRALSAVGLVAALAACAGAPIAPVADPAVAEPPPARPLVGEPPVAPPPDDADPADHLRMPASAFAGIAEVRTRAFAADDPRIEESALPPESAALRRSGLASAAQYRYLLDGEPKTQLRVRVDVYREGATAAEQLRGRHLPQALAMTEPLIAGDEGFIYEDLYAGFRVGPVIVEIRADGPNGRLQDFARAYAGFVESRLLKK